MFCENQASAEFRLTPCYLLLATTKPSSLNVASADSVWTTPCTQTKGQTDGGNMFRLAECSFYTVFYMSAALGAAQ